MRSLESRLRKLEEAKVKSRFVVVVQLPGQTEAKARECAGLPANNAPGVTVFTLRPSFQWTPRAGL